MSKWQTGVTDGTEIAKGFNNNNRFTSPTLMKPIVNNYRDAQVTALAATTVAGVANAMYLVPFYAGETFTIDRLGVVVTTLAAGALAKCVIYDTDTDGWPNIPVCAPTDDLDCSTTGLKVHTLSPAFQFEAGRAYWIGSRWSGTPTVRALPLGGIRTLGPDAPDGSSQFTQLLRTVTYGNAPPNPWTFIASELVGNPPAIVRFRTASVP